jgi:hypothetical protein
MSALPASMSLLVNTAPMAPAAPPSASADNGFARCLDQARDNGNDAAPAEQAPPRAGMKKPPSNTRADRDARDARAGRTAGTPEPPPKAARETDAATDEAQADAAHDDHAAPDLAALLPGWAPAPAAATAPAPAEIDTPVPARAAIGGANAATALPQNEASARALAQLTAAAANTDQPTAATAAPAAELQAAAS